MLSKEIKLFAVNSMYLYTIQGLNYLLPLMTLPYLIKTLSSQSFGIYGFAFAFAQFAVLFVDFGFNLSTTKKIAENSANPDFIKQLFWNVILIKFLFFLVTVVFSFFIITFIPKLAVYKSGIIPSFIMVFGTVFFPIWWFQGLNKIKPLSVINAFSKVLTYPFIFIFVKNADDFIPAIFWQGMSFVVASAISFVFIFKFHRKYFLRDGLSFSKKGLLSEIKDSFPIFLSNSSISLYTNSLTIFLGFFSNPSQVGIFSAMERLIKVICFGILGPVNQAAFPLIARLKNTDFANAKKLFKTIFIAVLSIMCLVFFVFLLFQNHIASYFFKGLEISKFRLIIFMLMIFPIALGGVLGQLGFLGLGTDTHKKIFSKIYIIIGLLSLPISVSCIYFFKLDGAIFSALLVEVSIFIFFLILNLKEKFL